MSLKIKFAHNKWNIPLRLRRASMQKKSPWLLRHRMHCIFPFLCVLPCIKKAKNKSIKPQSWIICREQINWKAPTISAFPAWPAMSYVVDPLAPQLIVYTTKSAFLAGWDNLAKWNYRPGPLPGSAARFHYLTVSLCRPGLSLGLASATGATFVCRAVGTKWGTLQYKILPKKRVLTPSSSTLKEEGGAWNSLLRETWILH